MAFLAATIALGAQSTTPPESSRPSFADFIAGVRHEALARGIRQEIADPALAIDEPLPIVLERDRTQAETVLSLEKYLARRLTAKRIRTGYDMLARHADLRKPATERPLDQPGAS